MGYALQIDLKEPAAVASNTGWGDFCRWVDSLPPDRFGGLHHLCEHGWTGDVPVVAQELRAAWKAVPSEQPGLKSTVEHAQQILLDAGDAEVVSVTDGLGAGADE